MIKDKTVLITGGASGIGQAAVNLFLKLNNYIVLGRGQAVRHRFLVAAFGGSNPPAPAN